MYAKSIMEYARERLAAGAWTKQLSFVPVAMALGVAVLPFTLDTRVIHAEAPVASGVAEEASPAGSMVRTANHPSARGALADDRRHALVADYMARRFYVSRQVVLDLVKTAHVVGRQYNVDPMLLVAVIAVESSFNPIAESVAGAKGLMQIIPHFHQEKFAEFGGEQAVFEPRTNIAVGAKIIREYLQAASGDLFKAMQTYGGALPDRDASYTHRVLNEKDRLDAIMGLPKTDRGARPSSSPAAVQTVPGGRIQMTIPPAPASNDDPAKAQPPAKSTEQPTAALPVNLAAAPRDK
jgi:soluble lytic murein transglycosylase-like protein